jgi:hypothetical protein
MKPYVNLSGVIVLTPNGVNLLSDMVVAIRMKNLPCTTSGHLKLPENGQSILITAHSFTNEWDSSHDCRPSRLKSHWGWGFSRMAWIMETRWDLRRVSSTQWEYVRRDNWVNNIKQWLHVYAHIYNVKLYIYIYIYYIYTHSVSSVCVCVSGTKTQVNLLAEGSTLFWFIPSHLWTQIRITVTTS